MSKIMYEILLQIFHIKLNHWTIWTEKNKLFTILDQFLSLLLNCGFDDVKSGAVA
jgi:hypothetical protein